MEKALGYHSEKPGKIGTVALTPLSTKEDLSLAYTPGVALPCEEIAQHPSLAYTYTLKARTVAIITDGTAVLGLGDIGPLASLPVMEGKAVLVKQLAGLDAFPLPIAEKDPQAFIDIVKKVSASFGAINLEDIAAPACFEIEETLKKSLDIPVFHDDQHGTAIVVYAALLNALSLKNVSLQDTRIVVSGAGAAGVAITKLLKKEGARDITVLDSKGIISEERELPAYKQELARMTQKQPGTLQDALTGADVFIGVSRPQSFPEEYVRLMNARPIIFALANPTPEIHPDVARRGGAAFIATGRSDYPNQINNILAFPGILKGAMATRATDVTHEMKVAAARAIAACVTPTPDHLLPDPLDNTVTEEVARAVARTAREQGVTRAA